MTDAEHAWIDDATDEEIVSWYEARPVTVSAAAAGGSIIGAFALGALVAVGALVVMGRLDLD
jgi:proteasome assembly chaperone (PAC2) family protein